VRAGHFRWGLIGMWILLSINSLWKVPSQGFDYPAHLEYIEYMTKHHIPPLATDGWQMFQTPMYYFVSSAWYKLCALFLNHEISERLLQIVPLVCGLAQIELCFSALRYIFPQRNDLQCLGMLLGGLLPMNLYMSQSLGNEPLAGFFTAIAVVLGIRLLKDFSQAGSNRNHWLLGIVLGLAILTKVTAILLLAPLLVILVFSLYNNDHKPATILAGCLRFLAGPFFITGWYFLRNWIELGRPYIGGWDPARKIIWWQDPGYRIAEQFTTFGESFVQPIYAARFGFWDAIYSSFWLDGLLSGVADYDARPPWNDSFLLCAPWLAILPTAAILLGGLAAIRHPDANVRRGLLFALACIGIYFAAVLTLYFQLPIYSTAKATYTLGLIPCYAILGAAGFDLMMRNIVLRAVVYGGMACWALFAYLAYFPW
jgi:hypothetical protein